MNIVTIKNLVVAYPSGNTTAVVLDDVSDLDKMKLNATILDTWSARYPDEPEIEQCCFVTDATDPNSIGKVEMFGGEFCGNATRSVVWLLTKGKDGKGLIEASGCDKPLAYTVNGGVVTLEMPHASTSMSEQGTKVQFDGITQLVIPFEPTRTSLKKLIKADSSLRKCSAVGLTNYNTESKRAVFSVWVREVDTIFDETACGSGTAAIGIALAAQTKTNQKLDVVQPSGEPITVATKVNDKGTPVITKISGKVRVLFSGEMKLLCDSIFIGK
jgi:diaminopimelate epimerase